MNQYTPDRDKPTCLRERIGVTLEIITADLPHEFLPMVYSSHGHHEGQVEHLNEEEDSFGGTTDPEVIPGIGRDISKSQRAMDHNLRHLQSVVPGLFICLKEHESNIQMYRGDRLKFTHVIRISPIPLDSKHGRNSENPWIDESGVHHLHLSVPRSRRHPHIQLRLTIDQLLFARDFLSLALPYLHYGLPHAPPGTDACVLVSAALDHATEAVAIIATYQAFASGGKQKVKNLLRLFDPFEAWRGAAGCQNSLGIMNMVSRMDLFK